MLDAPQQHETQSLRDRIEQSPDQRAEYTREFLSDKGVPVDQFIEDIKKTFGITIIPEDNKSLALGVYQLQKALGFAEEDGAKACDGKFGPYTYKCFRAYISKQNAQLRREELMRVVTSAPVISEQRLEESKLENTIFVGDSLTSHTKAFINGAMSCFKGGISTKTALKMLTDKEVHADPQDPKKEIVTYQLKPEYQSGKKIDIWIGMNNINNGWSLDDAVADVRRMIDAAHIDGPQTVSPQVVLFTLPDWNPDKGMLERIKKDYAKYFPNKPYPYDSEGLRGRVKEYNQKLVALAKEKGVIVVDMYTEMQDWEKYPRYDGLHVGTVKPSPNGEKRGAEAIAEFMKEKSNVVG